MTRKINEHELTPWFSDHERPQRNGIYQIAPFGESNPRWSYWNGDMWSFFAREFHKAAIHMYEPLHSANIKWRGLVKE